MSDRIQYALHRHGKYDPFPSNRYEFSVRNLTAAEVSKIRTTVAELQKAREQNEQTHYGD